MIARALAPRLSARGREVQLLAVEGGEPGQSLDLGAAPGTVPARVEGVGAWANALVENGAIPVVALGSASPGTHARAREAIRRLVGVHVECSRAPGVSACVPEAEGDQSPVVLPPPADILVDACQLTPEMAAEIIVEGLERNGWLSRGSPSARWETWCGGSC